MDQTFQNNSDSATASCLAPTSSLFPRSECAPALDPVYPLFCAPPATEVPAPMSSLDQIDQVDESDQCSQLFSGMYDGPATQSPATAPPTFTEETTSHSKTALQIGKFASDVLRIPSALRQAGKYGSEHLGPLTAVAPQLERAGATGERLLGRFVPKRVPQLVEQAKHVLGYANLDAKSILKHLGGKARELLSAPASSGGHLAESAVIAGERVAAKDAVAGGSRLLGKEASKLVPGLNVAISAGAAGLDLRDSVKNAKKGNYVGATIDGLHAATDGLGVVPGAGTLISLAGDALSIGAHWLSGR